MREWYTSGELIGLEGMPNSLTGIAQKSRRNDWLKRKASGQGRSFEYHISNFHVDVKKQLIEKYVQDPEEAEALLALGSPVQNANELLAMIREFEEKNPEAARADIFQKTKESFLQQAAKEAADDETDNSREPSNVSKITPLSEVKEWCELPVFDVHAAAGAGSLVHSEYQIERLILPTSMLSEFGLSPNTASIIYVNGDSMEPTLSDGDRLLVDIREQQHPVVNGVYVIRIDDAVYVKRLRWDIPKGIYEVISDNVQVQGPFEIDHNNGRNFKIIGKAVAPLFKKIF